MIAVSSYRPFGEHPLIDQMQIEAKQTWEQVFDVIFYVNEYSELLSSPKTRFSPTSPENPKPSISELSFFAGYLDSPFSVILNADIKLDPKTKLLPALLEKYGAECGVSRRITIGTNEFTDLGLDFFIATGSIWRRVADEFPPEYKDAGVFRIQSSSSSSGSLSSSRMISVPSNPSFQSSSTIGQSIKRFISPPLSSPASASPFPGWSS